MIGGVTEETHVAVVGGGDASDETCRAAAAVGAAIARAGAVVVCGGLGGVMEAACRGAREAGGRTLGILPGIDRRSQNSYLDASVVTGMGEGRNVLVVRSSDALIALPGGAGTLSEVALGIKNRRCVVGLRAWADVKGVVPAQDPEEAVRLALSSIREARSVRRDA